MIRWSFDPRQIEPRRVLWIVVGVAIFLLMVGRVIPWWLIFFFGPAFGGWGWGSWGWRSTPQAAKRKNDEVETLIVRDEKRKREALLAELDDLARESDALREEKRKRAAVRDDEDDTLV